VRRPISQKINSQDNLNLFSTTSKTHPSQAQMISMNNVTCTNIRYDVKGSFGLDIELYCSFALLFEGRFALVIYYFCGNCDLACGLFLSFAHQICAAATLFKLS